MIARRSLFFLVPLVASVACGARTDIACMRGECSGGTTFGGDASFEETASSETDPFDAVIPPEDTDFDFETIVDGAPVEDGTPSGDAIVLPPGCPSALPLAGTTCKGALDCGYPGCDPTRLDRAICSAGRWSVSATACTSTCPIAMPVDRSPCSIDSLYLCAWDVKCVTSAVGYCDKSARIWFIKNGSCAPECTTIPVEGSACSAGASCHFINSCGLGVSANCDEGKWYIGSWGRCDAPPPCPSTEPALGSPCSGSLRCGYRNACGTTDFAFCNDVWRIMPGKCSTPACPTTPSEGSACSPSSTPSCTYPIGGGCALACTCRSDSKSWHCEQTCASK